MPRKKSKHKRRMVSYRVREDLLNQLDKLTEESRRTATAEVELALEGHLTKAGLWPLPPTEPEKSDPPKSEAASKRGKKG